MHTEIVRAQRFAIPMTLRYRPSGQEQWIDGKVENISRSGVLFRVQKEVAVQTAVDITLVLESARNGVVPEVLCWGQVVRSVQNEGIPVLAAKILDYDFVRPGAREALAAAVPLEPGDRNLN